MPLHHYCQSDIISNNKMKKIHLLPNILTAFSLSCGLFIIFKMNMTPLKEVDVHVLTVTVGIMILAMMADVLDGALARAMKAESEFGGFFDSISDAITFGVAPSVIALKTLSLEPKTELSFFLTTAAMIFSVCGVLRLVRYNVLAQIAKEDTTHIDKNKNFTGLPITAAAGAAVSANLFLATHQFPDWMAMDVEKRAWILIIAQIILGYFMISRWKFPSLKSLQVRVASFQLVIVTVLCAALIFYGMLHHFPAVFFTLSWSYVLIAAALSIARMIAGKKARALEDFEPDPDDTDDTDT